MCILGEKFKGRKRAMGVTYYVSATDGNNNNPGNQPEKALRTIQAAINKVQAGDIVKVRAGTYAERLHIQKPGTADAPILITAYEGEQPVIDGANVIISDDTALVGVQQSQDVTLSGLTIRNAGGRGVLVNKSSRITIQGCLVETCYAGGIQAIQCDTLRIEKCIVHDCARRFLAHGPERINVALLTKYCTDVTIRDNQIYENSDRGIMVAVGCRQVAVHKNTCYDNRSGQIDIVSAIDVVVDSNLCYHTGNRAFLNLNGRRGPGITKSDLKHYETRGAWHSRNVQVSNNIVAGCGTGFRTGRSGGRLTGFNLTHNTIVNSTEQAIKVAQREPSHHAFIENNLIAANNHGDMVIANRAEGIVWRHNLWSSFPGPDVYNPSSDIVDSEVGLVNLNAPIDAGTVTGDAYKLTGNSIAINRGILRAEDPKADFWGAARDGMPDIGANEYPNGSGDEPVDDPVLPPPGTRVTSGLAVLYDFKEGQGREIHDVSSVGQPLNLRIKDDAGASWVKEGLEIKAPVIISSERPASKVISACRQASEITVEAWIRPANVTQDGPARIVSLSGSKTERNVTLGQGLHGNQPSDLYMARLRTTHTSTNGLPAVVTPPGTATNNLTHVVYTRAKNKRATLYVNGQDRGILDIGGDFSNWDERMALMLADEVSEDRPWLGLFNLVAIYSRALAPAEVLHNYEAGFLDDVAVRAEFTILPGDEYGVAPHVVEFDAADSTAVAGITGYFWEFGDGQTSNRAAPVYTYTTPGVYTVSLTITDAKGATDKVTKEHLITVVGSPISPLPADYARFVLINVESAVILAFGVQYPDLRCALMWNEEPFHMMVFAAVEDIEQGYTQGNAVEIVWVDQLEEE